MDLQEQVTSLEMSKRLEELGVEQKSLNFWVESTEGQGDYRPQCGDCSYEYGNNDVCSAFTVAELGVTMKDLIGDMGFVPQSDGRWLCSCEKIGEKPIYVYGETEVGARGQMLIYLLENKLI